MNRLSENKVFNLWGKRLQPEYLRSIPQKIINIILNQTPRRRKEQLERSARYEERMEIREALEKYFDEKYGIDTAGIIPISNLEIEDELKEHGVLYQSILPETFFYVINQLPKTLEGSIFVDFGSGKGRILLLASMMPLKKIIGVEYCRALHNVAVSNIALFQEETQKCRDIESCCTNAVNFPIPLEPAILFFYNPFDDYVMNKVIDNVRSSLSSVPRPLSIIYINPVFAHLWDRIPQLHRYEVRQPVLENAAIWTT